ncbi:MAG: DUF805 domain-containing protein [Succinivibrio sp.]|nr:DUF805 domain-containing protein [Succinivibrio sp.]
MTFVESIKTCLMQKFFSIQGRASRSEYWWFALFGYIVNLICNFIPYIGILVSLALLIPTATVAIRRCHDLGRSGWLLLAPTLCIIVGGIITFLGLYAGISGVMYTGIFLMILGAIGGVALSIYFIFPGTEGANRYGEGPYVFTEQNTAVHA